MASQTSPRFIFCAMAPNAAADIVRRNPQPCDIPIRMKATLVIPLELDAGCIQQWELLRLGNPIYASPFYSPHFAQAVGEVRRDAQVAIFEHEGRIAGFLPFHRVRKRIAKPIGGHMNDYHGAILAPGLKLSDPGLLEAAGIEAYDFDHLPLQLGRGTGAADTGQTSPQMDLRDGYERCVAAKGDSWKRGYSDMARKARKMARELGPVHFEFASSSADLFEVHAAMRNALYRRMGQREDYCIGWEGVVLRRLRLLDSPDFRGVLNVLYAGSQPVAMHFGLVSQGVLHWWFPAYDLSAQRYSPGLQLIDHCARQAASQAVSTIDFGKGDDRYKSLFADHSVAMFKGSVCHQGSPAARMRAGSDRLLTAVERFLPASVRSYPRRSVERLWTGTVLPQLS
jgi:CelD/BcsL family acetyltransferase involved in cellulose biosynthesis